MWEGYNWEAAKFLPHNYRGRQHDKGTDLIVRYDVVDLIVRIRGLVWITWTT